MIRLAMGQKTAYDPFEDGHDEYLVSGLYLCELEQLQARVEKLEKALEAIRIDAIGPDGTYLLGGLEHRLGRIGEVVHKLLKPKEEKVPNHPFEVTLRGRPGECDKCSRPDTDPIHKRDNE